MSKIKPKHAFSKKTFFGFHGIGNHELLSGEGASSMRNFRIRADGTLVGRDGYEVRLRFPKTPVRGVWEGILQGSSLFFAVASNTVYRVNLSAGTTTPCGTIAQGDTPVSFHQYGDILCLLDGTQMRVYMDGLFIPVEAYVPLYGKMWDPVAMGDVNEEINLLTPRIRLHYFNTIGATVFHLPYAANTIDSVRISGQSTSNYTFESGNNYVTIPDAAERVDVDICCTVKLNDAAYERMLTARTALAISMGPTGERMLLGGGSGDHCLYCSVPVDRESLDASREFYPNSCALYFKSEDVLFIGSAEDPISALCTHHNGVLAFNRTRIWFLEESKDGSIDAVPALKGLGASHQNAVTRVEQTLILSDRSGVYILDSPLSYPAALSAKSISPACSDAFASSRSEDAAVFYNRHAGEMWLLDPTQESGLVWVWNVGLQEWYCFSGIFAKALLDTEGGILFVTANALCAFSDALGTDDGQPIAYEYQSNYLDFGAPDATRRALRVCACARLGNATGTMEIISDTGSRTLRLGGSEKEAPDCFDFRVPLRRHRFLRYVFRVTSDHPVELLKVAFFTNV